HSAGYLRNQSRRGPSNQHDLCDRRPHGRGGQRQHEHVVAKIHAGVKLADVAVNPATDKIYVTDAQSPNIFVISGKTNKVTATIPVSGSGAGGTAAAPSPDMIYASASPGIVAISGKTNPVVATISGVGGFMAAAPATGLIYTNGATAS